ncbi:Scr1 family TA system antitoxin-like transcriptional regulator [Nocardiopsis terrae]|uniref:Scr1 family TA system antitoxin-like transcriptional regulator n=1 Tax=Streptomyces sp. NPDC057554 TaxID=3350538 RepID=UPI0036CECDCE
MSTETHLTRTMTENPHLDRALAGLHKHSTPEELRTVYEQHPTVTITRLATATGRSGGWVSRQLHRADTRMRPRGWQKRGRAAPPAPHEAALLKPSSPVLLHQLTRRLVELRTRCGLSQTQAARKVGVSHATLMRAENPHGALTQQLLVSLCTCYDAPPPVRDALLQLWQDSRAPTWWALQGLRVPSSRQPGLGLRADARRVYGWSDALVPELAQTAGYARAVEEAVGAHGSVAMAVSVLMATQRRVRRRGIDQRYVLDEAVIRRRVGGDQVMAEQLTVLRTLAKRGRLRVLAWDSGGYLPVGCFELCSIPGLDQALYMPRTRKIHLGDPPVPDLSLQFFQTTLERLWRWAEEAEPTVALLDDALDCLSTGSAMTAST